MKLRMVLAWGLLLSGGSALAQDQAQQNLRQQQQQEQNWHWYQMEQEAAQQQQLPPPPPPTGEWIKTWGAVAQGSLNGDTGVAVGQLTKEEAEAEAVRQCLRWGGGGCKPALVYYSQGAAIANPDGGNNAARFVSAASPELAG